MKLAHRFPQIADCSTQIDDDLSVVKSNVTLQPPNFVYYHGGSGGGGAAAGRRRGGGGACRCQNASIVGDGGRRVCHSSNRWTVTIAFSFLFEWHCGCGAGEGRYYVPIRPL